MIVAIIVTEFTSDSERAKAMSAYVFVAVGGGSIGLLAGGILTQALGWHWIFLVNVPVGIATLILGRSPEWRTWASASGRASTGWAPSSSLCR